jgi:hypothetical protein
MADKDRVLDGKWCCSFSRHQGQDQAFLAPICAVSGRTSDAEGVRNVWDQATDFLLINIYFR